MVKSSKKLSQKAKKIIKSDLFTSIAIVSLVLNVFLLAGLYVLTSADTFDREVYLNVKERYCKNPDAVIDRGKELGSNEKALQEWQVSCISKEFLPYYKEALQKFEASSKN